MTINGRHEFLEVTQKTTYPGTVIEQQHIFPAPNIDKNMQDKLANYVINLLKIINYRHGPCHIEVIVKDDSIYLVEINNRGGGDFIWQMVLLVRGVDVIRETLDYAFSNNYNELIRLNNKQYEMMSAIAFFSPVDIEKIRTKIELMVKIVRIYCKPNDGKNIKVNHSWDRFGFLVIGLQDKNEFQKILPTIQNLVKEEENRLEGG